MLPLITQLNKEPKSASDKHTGTCSAVVGSTIYRFGGGSRMNRCWSRKVIYFVASRPQEGWKRGPHTLCGRESVATVTLHGKLYVFGGCSPANHGFLAEFLDKTSLVEEEGKAKGEWIPVPDPPCALGFEKLSAVAVDGGRLYAGKILVGSKLIGDIFLYDETNKLWTGLGIIKLCGALFSPPVVVDATIYIINLVEGKLHTYDFLAKTELSMRIGDFKICRMMGGARCAATKMNPMLLHLTTNIFGVVWIGDDHCLHCTKLQVSTARVIGATVLCCHSYEFDHQVRLIYCLPMNPSLLISCLKFSIKRARCL